MFILAGVLLSATIPQIIRYIKDKASFNILGWIIVCSFWTISFGTFYILSIQTTSSNEELQTDLQQDLSQFFGRQRIWILIADRYIRQQTAYMLALLNQFGQPVEQFKLDKEASLVQLYDFSQGS